MKKTSVTRGVAALVGGLAIVGMGVTVGCSPKQAPAPTEQTDNPIESKRSAQKEPGAKEKPGNSFGPKVKAPAAPTGKAGDN